MFLIFLNHYYFIPSFFLARAPPPHADPTPQSLRLSTLVVWAICFFVAIGTFKDVGGLKYTSPIGLYITYLIFPLACVVIYAISQLILVIRTLDDRWAIGSILSGIAFYVIGIVLLLGFSTTICSSVSHYIDGTFFFSICMLLSVMMVYKYWDCKFFSVFCPPPLIPSSFVLRTTIRKSTSAYTYSRLLFVLVLVLGLPSAAITKEDLEFSVGSKANVWEVKDPLLPPNADYMEEDTQSAYHGAGGSLIGGKTGNNFYGTPSMYGGYMNQQRSYAASSASGHGGGGGRQYQSQAGYTGGYGS